MLVPINRFGIALLEEGCASIYKLWTPTQSNNTPYSTAWVYYVLTFVAALFQLSNKHYFEIMELWLMHFHCTNHKIDAFWRTTSANAHFLSSKDMDGFFILNWTWWGRPHYTLFSIEWCPSPLLQNNRKKYLPLMLQMCALTIFCCFLTSQKQYHSTNHVIITSHSIFYGKFFSWLLLAS